MPSSRSSKSSRSSRSISFNSNSFIKNNYNSIIKEAKTLSIIKVNIFLFKTLLACLIVQLFSIRDYINFNTNIDIINEGSLLVYASIFLVVVGVLMNKMFQGEDNLASNIFEMFVYLFLIYIIITKINDYKKINYKKWQTTINIGDRMKNDTLFMALNAVIPVFIVYALFNTINIFF